MKYKNYYKILGLANAKVSDGEIKSAYRHLAKLYHPDLNPGNDIVADKFKDVNEAYQILGNPALRKKYDRVHFAYKFRTGLKREDIESKININTGAQDFIGMLFGKKKTSKIITNFDKYYSKNQAIDGENLESEIEISLEEAFFGGERKIAFKISDKKLKTIIVNIPRGLKTGEIIRLSGQGRLGENGGKNGDMLIKVNILPHSKFKIEGSNLITELLLTPWEAALGCEIGVEGIDSNVLLTIPECSTTGDKFRVPNGGYIGKNGERGDLLINVKITLPKRLTKEEKELFNKFKEVSTYNPRKNV